MLYADDMLLFMEDVDDSLSHAMPLITDFGHYSGLTINWSKSALMFLDGAPGLDAELPCPVPVVTSFKFLGIHVSLKLTDYCSQKYIPLTDSLQRQNKHMEST